MDAFHQLAFLAAVTASLPVTVFVGFVGFAIGRRQFSVAALLWLIGAEAIAICLALIVSPLILDVSG